MLLRPVRLCPTEDTCVSYEEEDTCVSYEEEDTCVSYEEEDTCVSYEEEDTCVSYEAPLPYCARALIVLQNDFNQMG